jgi:hypothetical protein
MFSIVVRFSMAIWMELRDIPAEKKAKRALLDIKSA